MKLSGSFCLALSLALVAPALLSPIAEVQARPGHTNKRKMARKTRSTKVQCQLLLSQNTTDAQLLTRYDKLNCDQVLSSR